MCRANQRIKFPNKSKVLCLIFLLLLIAVSGCGEPQHKVVATWTEPFEQRVDERIKLGPPVLKTIEWSPYSVILMVHLEQLESVYFDLEKRQQKFQAVRYLTESSSKGDGGDVGLGGFMLAVMASINPLGAALAGGVVSVLAISGIEEAKERDKIEKFTISQLKSGVSQIDADLDFGASTKAFKYKREAGDEKTKMKIVSDQREDHTINAVQVPVKLENQWNPSSVQIQRTNNRGWAPLVLAKNYVQAVHLKPSKLLLLAQWQGKWLELGTAELTKERISQIVDKTRTEALSATGVPTLPPLAKVSVKVPEGKVEADMGCELSLTVENTGKGEFYCLVATSESVLPVLDGLKFEFGKLAPNETLTLTKQVLIPRLQPTGPVLMRFKWSELNGFEPDPVLTKLMIHGLAEPEFAVSVQVLDDNSGNSVGNGDGRIQKGEAVDLLIAVKNIGEGAARNVKIRLDEIAQSGVVVNVGERYIGEIIPGGTKQDKLTITTKKSTRIDKLNPKLRIFDEYLGIEYQERLVLPLETELAPSIMTYKMKVYTGEEEVAIRGGAGDDTAIVARAEPHSTLQATGELGRWIRVELPQQHPGWVHRSGVTFRPPVQPAASQVSGGVVYILQPQVPLIAVAKPLNDSMFDVSWIEVAGAVADDQVVSGIEFKLNGREIDFVRIRGVAGIGKIPLNPQRELNFSFWINLVEGKNEIEIIAWDNEGLKAQKKIYVTYEKDRGNVYVVCIGIGKYKNVRPAKYAVADAQEMADCFRRRLRVPEKNIYILLNDKATLECIKETIGVKVRKHAGRADTVIIYFAGHGAYEPDNDSLDDDGMSKYLLPFEARSSSLFPTALAMEDVIRLLRRLVSERVVFLADTCFSGAIGGRSLRSTEAEFRLIDINQDNLLKRLRDTGTGRVILTACRGTEASQAKDELGHGVFTYYLLRGLEGKGDNNEDGMVTITELYQYVSVEVPKATENSQYPMIKFGEMAGEIIVSMAEEGEY